MANDWSSKEKIALLSDILEFGDQPESWSAISNDLSRTFQSRKEGRFSIKNCKHEYKSLVDRYKPQWIQNGSTNGLKLPLAKYIWIQLKSIYQAELTDQLKENRKKLTEIYLQLETTIHIKPNTNEAIPTSVSEISTPIHLPQENEEEKTSTAQRTSQSISDIQPNEPDPSENNASTLVTAEISSKEHTTVSDQPKVKEEVHTEIPAESNRQLIASTPSNPEADLSSSASFDSSSLNNPPPPPEHPSIPSQLTPLIPSPSSSRSTSRTSSETKIDHVKVTQYHQQPGSPSLSPSKTIPTTTTTPKYHLYFSPKNSTSNTTSTNVASTKIKTKRKAPDEIKDDHESETAVQPDLPSSSSTEQSKNPSSAAPVTRRSINTRSVPNTAVEQEEEKSRRFSAMLSENPNSWQSQSMAIIQFLLSQKQGYLFEHEITDEIAPKYHKFIRRPIALHTIRKTLEANVYQSKEYFRRDIYLMLYNAMKYNPRHHHVHRSAKHLFNIAFPLFNLSPAEIHAQIVTKSNVATPTSAGENPFVKRQRIK